MATESPTWGEERIANELKLGTGWRQNRSLAALVMSETGVAVILLVGSALLIRSFVALYRLDRGIRDEERGDHANWLSGTRYLAEVRHDVVDLSDFWGIQEDK
jgi:hypothetical protein